MSPSEGHSADPSVRVISADGRQSVREWLQASGSGRPYRRYPARDAAARQLAGMACATPVRGGLATRLDGERSGQTAGNAPNAIGGRPYGHPGMTSRQRTEQGRATATVWNGGRCGRRAGLQRSCCYAHRGARAVRRTRGGSPRTSRGEEVDRPVGSSDDDVRP